MERRQHARASKLDAERLIRNRGVSYAQPSRDLGVHLTMLRNWVKRSVTIRSTPSGLIECLLTP